MGRHYSFDDQRVGKGDGDYFKVTGTKDRPQRIAYIPYEAQESQLVVTPELKRRADAGDKAAREEIEDVQTLREEITKSLKKMPPSAEVWVNEQGKKVILYAKSEGAKTFWIDGLGHIYWKEGVPAGLLERPPQIVYGLVLLEYELDAENEPVILAPDRQIDLGSGHKLRFKYKIKPWSINDPKVRAWKEHSRSNPVIRNDYLVWTQKDGQFDRTKFSPAGPSLWRDNHGTMCRIIREARGAYENLPKTIAKDFSVSDIIELASHGSRSRGHEPAQPTMMAEEINFADLLGSGGQAVSAPEQAALGHGPVQGNPEFPSLETGLEGLLTSSPREEEVIPY